MIKRRPSTTQVCAYCKKTFLAQQNKIERGEDKFCSNACRKAGRGYVEQVFALLPSTVPQIMEATGLSGVTVRAILDRLVERGRCHLAKLVRLYEHGGQSFSPYFIQFKPGPKPLISTLPQTIRGAQNLLTLHIVLGAMPANVIELTEKTGLSRGSVKNALKVLHAPGAARRCFIYRWRRITTTGGLPTYKIGNHPDVPNNIIPLTSEERKVRYQRKVKLEGRIGEVRAKSEHSAGVRRRIKAGDILINALFGKPSERLKEAA